MIKDICRPSVIQFFVISTLLACTNAYVVHCRRTTRSRDDGRFGYCESGGKLNTDTYANPDVLGLSVQNLATVDHANFTEIYVTGVAIFNK